MDVIILLALLVSLVTIAVAGVFVLKTKSIERGPLPPVHPSCRCQLVVYDDKDGE